VPRLACTATADEPTRLEIIQKLRLGAARIYSTGFDRPNIRYTIVAKRDPLQQLLRFIKERHANSAGIVYCFTRQSTEETAARLTKRGLPAPPIMRDWTSPRARCTSSAFWRRATSLSAPRLRLAWASINRTCALWRTL
jgi:superfamily II DNA helicase RecQ